MFRVRTYMLNRHVFSAFIVAKQSSTGRYRSLPPHLYLLTNVVPYIRLSACSFNGDEPPYFTGIFLQEGAAGKTDIGAIVVMDGISNAKVSRTNKMVFRLFTQ